MTSEYTYERLFSFVFPDWKGTIPLFNNNNNNNTISENTTFLSDDSEDSKCIVSWFIIWEVISDDGFSNIGIKQEIKSMKTMQKILRIRLHLKNENQSVEITNDLELVFSSDCIHFLPNSSWVFSMEPRFFDSIDFFDPLLGKWFLNTEAFLKFDKIIDISSTFCSNNIDVWFTSFIDIYDKLIDSHDWLKIEMEHMRILGKMHIKSFRFDFEKAEDLKNEIMIKLDEIKKEIFSISKVEFNILSPYEVSDILFNHLNIKIPKINENTISIDSRHRESHQRIFAPTNIKVLSKIKHPITNLILRYRALIKVLSNWLNFKKFCSNENDLHPFYHTCSTSTGRISTTNPNLQNVPSFVDTLNIRNIFLPYDNNYTLISLDYSQLELRILAHFAQDKKLTELCNDLKNDIHMQIAQLIFGLKNVDMVTMQQRKEAKQSVYKTIYGKEWNNENKKSNRKIDSLLKTFPNIQKFINEATIQATKNGYVETLCGKKRILPNINSSSSVKKQRDIRIAVNTIIQGSAADFVKFALIEIMKNVHDIEPLLQIHDEWIFQTKYDVGTNEFSSLIRNLQSYSQCYQKIGLKVPIPSKIKFGKNFGNMNYL